MQWAHRRLLCVSAPGGAVRLPQAAPWAVRPGRGGPLGGDRSYKRDDRDSLVDMEFGRRVGMATILVEEETEFPSPGAAIAREREYLWFPSLSTAVSGLLGAR